MLDDCELFCILVEKERVFVVIDFDRKASNLARDAVEKTRADDLWS